jgi:hypothetical protein
LTNAPLKPETQEAQKISGVERDEEVVEREESSIFLKGEVRRVGSRVIGIESALELSETG